MSQNGDLDKSVYSRPVVPKTYYSEYSSLSPQAMFHPTTSLVIKVQVIYPILTCHRMVLWPVLDNIYCRYIQSWIWLIMGFTDLAPAKMYFFVPPKWTPIFFFFFSPLLHESYYQNLTTKIAKAQHGSIFFCSRDSEAQKSLSERWETSCSAPRLASREDIGTYPYRRGSSR